MTEERWLPVVGWEGLYEVSDHGRVRSLPRRAPNPGTGGYRDWPGTVRSQFDHKLGYKMVRLHRDGERKSKYVHALVLEAFVGARPDGGMYGCHNDGDPTNNVVVNLRWGTPSSNQQDAIRHGTHAGIARTHCRNRHAYTPENTGYAPNGQRRCHICREAQNRKRAEWRRRHKAA